MLTEPTHLPLPHPSHRIYSPRALLEMTSNVKTLDRAIALIFHGSKFWGGIMHHLGNYLNESYVDSVHEHAHDSQMALFLKTVPIWSLSCRIHKECSHKRYTLCELYFSKLPAWMLRRLKWGSPSGHPATLLLSRLDAWTANSWHHFKETFRNSYYAWELKCYTALLDSSSCGLFAILL